MVTKQGHMISSYLSGMKRQQQQQPAPLPGKGGPPKKPLRPQRSAAAVVENGHEDLNGLSERTTSTHIKSVGQQVERYEGQLSKSRPSPASRGPRPVRPPRPRHAPLRVTQSVPIHYTKPPVPVTTMAPSAPVAPSPAKKDSGDKPGAMYEVPVRKPQQTTGGGKSEGKRSPPYVLRVEEVHYEVSDNIEEPLQPVTKPRKMNEARGRQGGRSELTRSPPQLPKLEEAPHKTSTHVDEPPQPKTRPLLPPPTSRSQTAPQEEIPTS